MLGIQNKIDSGRYVICMSNGVSWDERSTSKIKLNTHRTTVKELCLRCEVWQIKNKTKYPNSGGGILEKICKIIKELQHCKSRKK